MEQIIENITPIPFTYSKEEVSRVANYIYRVIQNPVFLAVHSGRERSTYMNDLIDYLQTPSTFANFAPIIPSTVEHSLTAEEIFGLNALVFKKIAEKLTADEIISMVNDIEGATDIMQPLEHPALEKVVAYLKENIIFPAAKETFTDLPQYKLEDLTVVKNGISMKVIAVGAVVVCILLALTYMFCSESEENDLSINQRIPTPETSSSAQHQT